MRAMPSSAATRDRLFIVALGLLLLAHVAVHGYHIALALPPPAKMRWSVIVPIWCTFALLHGFYALGWRRTLWMLGLTAGVSLAFEYVGVKTGWPFGTYYYTDVLGPKLMGTVPLIIPFAYFMMLYPSHVITNLILDGTPVSAQRRMAGIVAASVLTALVMTAWDLTTDPVMAGAVGAWVWVDGGPYFGIPMENFLGWVVVVAVICFVYRWTEPAVPLRPMGSPKRWIALGPLIGYGTMALGDALVGLPEATRLLPWFAMGAPLLAAVVRLLEARLRSAHG
jgi:putative membrane protein